MFDIGASELLVIVIVAVLVIGPKDLPLALRTAGRWIGKVRRISAQFRTGFDAMVREAEMEEMEKKWKEQNARIMAENPSDTADPSLADLSADQARPGIEPSMTPLAAPSGHSAATTGGAGDADRTGHGRATKSADDNRPAPSGKPETDQA